MSEGIERLGADSVVAESETGISVVLWTRRPVCGPRTTVIDRLGTLQAEERLAGFSVEIWPEEIVVSDPGDHDELLDRVDRFEQWATDNGLSVRPPFETRTKSLLVGASETVLKTPMLGAAVYEGDSLIGFFPCTDGEHTWTVSEYLTVLENDREELPHESSGKPVPVSGERDVA